MQFDPDHNVLLLGERAIRLTKRECEVMRRLTARPGELVTRETLEREVWRLHPNVRSEAVPIAMRRLRKKLGDHLALEKGRGWRIVVPSGPEPAPLPELFGRDTLLDVIARLLAEGVRVITLHGPGGVGKTTVAQQVHGSHGGLFFELSATTTLDAAWAELARALDVPTGTDSDPRRAVIRALQRASPPVVVLDNLEQLGADGALLVDAVAAVTTVVGTSREPTGASGERRVRVGPLSTEDARALYRRRVTDQGLTPQTDGLDALLEMLEGLPLAVELAAARAALLSPGQVAERLHARFDWLSDPRRRGRQSTLEACVLWSWELLSPVEADALEQLSIFEAAFDLEDAEAVVADVGWVGDVVQQLLERSLLQRTDTGRLRLLLGVRHVGRSRLQGERLDAVRIRHAQHFAPADALLPEEGAGSRSRDELLAAAASLPRSASSALHARVGRAMWTATRSAGPTQRSLELLDGLLARPLQPADRVTLWACRLAAGNRISPDLARAEAATIVLAEGQGDADPLETARLQVEIARHHEAHARWDPTEAMLDAARAIYERAAHATGLATVDLLRARVRFARNQREAALDLGMSALQHAETCGRARLEIEVALLLATLERERGDLERSSGWVDHAERRNAGARDVQLSGMIHYARAGLYKRAGLSDECRRSYALAAEDLATVGSDFEQFAHGALGTLAAQNAEPELARDHFMAAVRALRTPRRTLVWRANLGCLYHEFDLGRDPVRALAAVAHELESRQLIRMLHGVRIWWATALRRAGRADEARTILNANRLDDTLSRDARERTTLEALWLSLDAGEPVRIDLSAFATSDWRLPLIRARLQPDEALQWLEVAREAMPHPRHPRSSVWADFDAVARGSTG